MIDKEEIVVRVLFPNKVIHGKVMGGAFALRAQRSENYISVFREIGPTFHEDIMALDKGRNLDCAEMKVEDIQMINFEEKRDIIYCDIMEIAGIDITSHAGIVTFINQQILIGGHESIIRTTEEGTSIDIIVLAIQHRLAMIAQKGLTKVNNTFKHQ